MEINNFSAIIQLAATLCIAFIAVEYVKSFIGILCERFFKFQDFIADSFAECRLLLTDKETLEHIDPIIIDGKSTNSEIEEVKRQNEALTKEIDEEEGKKKEEMKIFCQVRSMSSLCFFLFMVNISLLMFGGIEKSFPDFSHVSVSFLNILSTAYLLCGWVIGECEYPRKYTDFSSLKHASISYVIIASLSLVIGIAVLLWKQKILLVVYYVWQYSVMVIILLTYLNFIVFTFKIKIKAKEFKNQVGVSKKNLIEKCKKTQQSVEELKGVSRLNARLRAD